MATLDETLADDDYDEFALLHENAAEWGLTLDDPLPVARASVEVTPGEQLSYIRWGTDDPEVVFLHGGGQNAHTWDTVALALRRPALVGMSLGGATAIRLAASRSEFFRGAVVIDVTPQVNDATRQMTTAERGSVALISGPPTYESFDAMADAAIALTPNRPAAAVRRGVRHNAHRLPDGRWTWRYDLFGPRPEGADDWSNFTSLWDDVESIPIPTMLVRGGTSKYVLDADEAEMRRRLPSIRVEVVAGAGHAVQSDRPLELVRLLEDFAFPS
jgi:pimeloyl-ACP methyl ester carboxylesterase